MRRLGTVAVIAIAMLAVVAVPAAGGGGGGGGGGSGGPITLMGIDGEDGSHGDPSLYAGLLADVNSNVNKSGTGIAVMGTGKGADTATSWWNDVAGQVGLPITHVNGAAAISAFDFSPFRIIGVATGHDGHLSGGLTQEEHDALSARSADIQSFVRGGGGIFAQMSDFDPTEGAGPYAWIAGAAPVVARSPEQYEDVSATPDGQALGITDTNLDVCCWHQVFDSFPSFLLVLAVHNDSAEPEENGKAAAIGGARVFGGKCPGAQKAKGNHIVGTKKKDVIRGTRERDVICGLGGNDRLLGKFGNDLILGGSGDDTILGGHGNDKLKGEDGNDLIRGMVGADKHIGGPGTDRCNGGRGNDSFKTCENKS